MKVRLVIEAKSKEFDGMSIPEIISFCNQNGGDPDFLTVDAVIIEDAPKKCSVEPGNSVQQPKAAINQK